MQTENYLLWANVAVWIGIAAYAAFLQARSARIEQRISQLEQAGGHDQN